MSKKDLSRDQKRKKKLAERAKKERAQTSPLAYTGNRYKTDALTPVYLHTETGIYETFVMTDRQLTDREVASALERMVLQMRQGPLPAFDESGASGEGEGNEELIIWNIRRNWQELYERNPRLDREAMIGVLRTLLGSIETWSTPSAQSRGYLHFVEGFLKKAGVRVEKVSPDTLEPVAERKEEDLLTVGRVWCAGDDEAGERFRELAEQMTDAGHPERVAEIAQQLLGEISATGPDWLIKDLSALAIRAQRAMK